ncbi:MAG: hypothetical protein N2691_05525 [Patescibacteria group bacterium]|nr:hypothetical protein [Patescibacteria group bacterium]
MRSPAIAIGIATALWCVIFLPGRSVYARAAAPSPQFFLKFEELPGDPEPTAVPTPEPARDTLLYGEELMRFEREGFVVSNTFPFDDSPVSLGFGISDTRIEFLEPRPDKPQEQSVTISTNADGWFGYQVLAIQDNPLKNSGSLTIPVTGCDRRPIPCSPTYAREWRRSGGYGFGYRMESQDAPIDFLAPDTYRPFPLSSAGERAVPVLGASFVRGERRSVMRFRLNVPPDFQENTYFATVTILALPRL